ncbi:MAG TPA: GMC family oxidoreductase [Chthoniobacterales bacterium]
MNTRPQAFTDTPTVLNPAQAATLAAFFDQLFPADESGPGAAAIGVLAYLDRALGGPCSKHLETYRLGVWAMDAEAVDRFGKPFAEADSAQQQTLIRAMEDGSAANFRAIEAKAFFELARSHLQEGLFADPIYGGNRDKAGWRFLRHPGVFLENSAEENLTDKPVDKGGEIRSLADLNPPRRHRKPLAGYDPQRGTAEPASEADVLLVGAGAMGSLVAPLFARAGLKVVALEPGPFRTECDYLPDELGAAYYCRASMGPKFLSEVPRWRTNPGEPTREATFSLGRMMNGVGGSVIHYGAWLRRFHPHHFRMRSHVKERWGLGVLPAECTLADWPLTYEQLEPYYTLLEHEIGVAGDDADALLPRSKPFPMPPMRPFRLGEYFRNATGQMGLHAHPVPVGVNTVPYRGRPAATYSAWSNGFGSITGDKWDPSLTCIPEALATGNLDLRTQCRVIRIVTDGDGRVSGAEYVDPLGRRRLQKARAVILSAYTFENVRLLFLSGDARHPEGLGNNRGQLGKHFMTKMFAHVDGYVPGVTFNRHTGPAAQGLVLDDFFRPEFDPVRHGFIGGATLGAEQQFLPIQISREALPPDVQRWGKPYKEHLRQWQHFGVVRIQPDTLSYAANCLELDPHHRDRSGLGLPVLRITYDLRENEHRLSDWMETKAEEILRLMGATRTWRGDRFTGVGSSHDFGGARMGDDPGKTVVNADLRVHDTPGLYVYSGAVFPTCPGINPTLTLAALVYRAAEKLARQMAAGEAP